MGKHIVVIDDSATICKILAIGLGRAGYRVTCFADGVEALRWLHSSEAIMPDLVLLDILLPKMDGYAVARHLKAIPVFVEKAVPIVFLTCLDGLLDQIKGRLAGASAYLTKPFRMTEVCQVVQRLLTESPDGSSPDQDRVLRQ